MRAPASLTSRRPSEAAIGRFGLFARSDAPPLAGRAKSWSSAEKQEVGGRRRCFRPSRWCVPGLAYCETSAHLLRHGEKTAVSPQIHCRMKRLSVCSPLVTLCRSVTPASPRWCRTTTYTGFKLLVFVAVAMLSQSLSVFKKKKKSAVIR